MGKKTVSDSIAKKRCKEFLESKGYDNIISAGRDEGCDLKTDNDTIFFEIKYSSKPDGNFFGTVMLTELHKAVTNEDNYYFIVCRGKKEDPFEKWFFNVFNVKEFLDLCTLTTPIFHYHLRFSEKGNIIKPKHKKETVKASEKLVKKMWNEFKRWKNNE